MTHFRTGAPATALPPRPFSAIADRLKGPGGFYNAGNLLGLSVALATQFALATTSATASLSERLGAYFGGSPSAVALSLATAIFLVSGETYHRAWAGGGLPSPRLNRIADLLAAGGATALTFSLIFSGQLTLAVASGLLIVGGKLGSAITCDDRSRVQAWPANWKDPFRTAVLAGRGPGLVAAALDLGRHVLDQPSGIGLWSLLPSATLVVCYGLWIKADLLLLGSAARPQPRTEMHTVPAE
jgi:hypothetical protein